MKRTKTFLLALLCTVLYTLPAVAAEDVEVTIHLETPNTLALSVVNAGYHPTTITKLTLSGEVGDDDWTLLKSNFTSLYYLDMSGTTATAIPDDAFKSNTLLQTYIFPENTKTIGSSAFYYCSGLIGSLTIPEGVTSISYYAFCRCTGLTGSLTIPEGVTISSLAFRYCSGLTSLIFEDGVTTVAAAFDGCTGITTVISYSETPPTCTSGCFSSIDKDNCTLKVPSSSIVAYLMAAEWGTFINITEIEEGDDTPETPTYLTLSVWEQGATRLEMAEGSTLSLQLVPAEGWTINSVSYNGVDVTDELDGDNFYTTPAIANGDALVVTYLEVGSSAVATTSASSNIKVYASASNQITVVGAESGDQIAVYTVSGSAVAQRVASSDTEQVTVTSGAVYIVRVGNYTFKLAL